MARLSSDAAGRQAARRLRIFGKSFSTLLASYPGDVAIASTRPVDGSRATAAPQLPASALWAMRWSRGSIVSTTLLPTIVLPASASSFEPSTVRRLPFEPVR